MNETTQSVATTKESKILEFVPFGAKDPIKLSVSIIRNLIAKPTKSGKLASDNDCIKFLMMCQAKRLNPFEGDCYLTGYDTQNGPEFSQITAHQAFLKRAELNKEYDGMESGVIVIRDTQIMDLEGDFHLDDDKLIGGWARVFFKSRSKPMAKRLRLSVFNKGKSQWAANPAGMIVKCAEADALRSSFPTMLGGLYTDEEMSHTRVPERSVTKPIFGGTTPLEIGPRNSEDEPALPPEVERVPEVTDEVTEKVRLLCLRSSIGESTLIGYLAGSGIADMGDSIEATHAKFPKTMPEVIKRWDDILADLTKEVEV